MIKDPFPTGIRRRLPRISNSDGNNTPISKPQRELLPVPQSPPLPQSSPQRNGWFSGFRSYLPGIPSFFKSRAPVEEPIKETIHTPAPKDPIISSSPSQVVLDPPMADTDHDPKQYKRTPHSRTYFDFEEFSGKPPSSSPQSQEEQPSSSPPRRDGGKRGILFLFFLIF